MKLNITDKDMARLFYHMYTGCLQYNKQHEKDKNTELKLDCNEFYNHFKFYAEKYIDSKNK